ncbi:MAG: L,D-transpeptidase family protein [Hyphomicrobiaceae bacterium]|nr:L,D-transpeptidase family protein [Hyphomicrobiaceae bacterium]MDX2449419.1 L,D-transpeptidase family protein [Hyphomicrobiaceae bacterium]
MTRVEAAKVARKTLSTLSICLGVAALAATVAVVPADAKKRKKTVKVENTLATTEAHQPMTLIVSLRNQKVDIYRGTTLITSSSVSTGKRGHATKAGVFSILEKRRRHYSNLYNGAPMPWMQRLTWSGTALHAGVVPGYPASHGCIRLPYSFAPKLFSITDVGGQVVVAHGKVTPKLIEHSELFQPLPLPAPPSLAKQDDQTKQMRRSSNETAPAFGSSLPIVLAKAETSDIAATHAPVAQQQTETEPRAAVGTPAQRSVSVALQEDTRVHAIDPYAVPFMGSGSHGIAAKPPANAVQSHAEVSTFDDFTKLQSKPADSGEPAAPAPSAVVPTASAPTEAVEPQAEPILSLSATVVEAEEPAPPALPVKLSATAIKLGAGAAAAAIEAAEPRSTAPLRILVTRSTKRDRMIGVQYILASMGFLEVQNFDGTFGRKTAQAIKAFQNANNMAPTGAFTDDVVERIYDAADKKEPPTGHLFVRQEFDAVFDTPVRFRNPDAKLGTHLFTVMNFGPDDTKAQWMAVSLKGDDDPSIVLDRIVIPDDVRQNISVRLTPGSSLVIADTAINSATLPKGADFLVWDNSQPAKVHRASVAKPRARKRRRVTTQRRVAPTQARRARRYYRRPGWPF